MYKIKIISNFIIMFLVLNGFYSCGSNINVPIEQQNYSDTYWNLESKWSSATTDAKKSHAHKIYSTHRDQKLLVNNWYGNITEVGIDYITVEYDDIKYYLYPKGEGINYLEFDKNMKLLFTGRLVGKGSWYQGIYVDCLKIISIDESEIYFKVTTIEMDEYQAEVEAKEKLNKELAKGWKEFKNTWNELKETN